MGGSRRPPGGLHAEADDNGVLGEVAMDCWGDDRMGSAEGLFGATWGLGTGRGDSLVEGCPDFITSEETGVVMSFEVFGIVKGVGLDFGTGEGRGG